MNILRTRRDRVWKTIRCERIAEGPLWPMQTAIAEIARRCVVPEKDAEMGMGAHCHRSRAAR